MKRVSVRFLHLATTAVFLGLSDLRAQAVSVPSDSLLAAITARGRALAAYDRAAWLGSDALLALDSAPSGIDTYLAEDTPAGWRVLFGRAGATADTFLVVYQVTAVDSTYLAKKLAPPRPETGFPALAAEAIRLVRQDFGNRNRTYNVAVLPDEPGAVWVYLTPAPVHPGVFPHGGDRRYRVGGRPVAILETRELHRSILEYPIPDSAESGMHTALVDDVPEDTDVFWVLTRGRLLPELVVSEHYIYQVCVDGTITWERR